MNFYLIQLRNHCVLYTEGDRDQSKGKNDAQDRIDRIIQALADRQVGWANLLSRLIRAVRDVYYRLENRIDPMECVFKRMRHDKQLTVYVSSSLSKSEALAKLKSLLANQRNRHAAWMICDALLALGALALTPFLVPIPGPNLFLYYPALRAFSHYLAYQGAVSGLRQHSPALVALGEIEQLEHWISRSGSSSSAAEIRELSLKLKLEKLSEFLVRYS